MGGLTGNGHEYTYDDRGRVSAETVWIDGSSYETAYTYDAADRLLTTTYPDGEEVTATWNMQGLPETMSSDYPQTYVSQAEYNALSQMELLDFGPLGGGQTDYTYYTPEESNNRLERIQVAGTQASFDLSYAYDSVGNVATITDLADGGGVQTFTYDALDRLTGASGAYIRTYAYDEIGNIDNFNGRSSAPRGQWVLPRPAPRGNVGGHDTFTYDKNGNMTERVEDGVTYQQTWDYENRLISVTANGLTTTFTYDADGALIKKQTPYGTRSTSAVTTKSKSPPGHRRFRIRGLAP